MAKVVQLSVFSCVSDDFIMEDEYFPEERGQRGDGSLVFCSQDIL